MAGQPGHGYGAPPPPPPRGYRGAPHVVEKGFFGSLFDFRFEHFVATKVVKFLYVLAFIVVILAMIAGVVGGFLTLAEGDDGSFIGILWIVGALLGGPLLLLFYRIMFETLIVRFRMAQDISIIRQRGDLR